LKKELAALQAELPVGAELSQIQDQPEAVKRSVGEFVKVLIEAVGVVLAVSFISLGLHTRPLRIDIWPGLVVALTIPLVLAITFVTMYYWGVGLHKISLGSLIIALGLLVDDAIIAVEMMVRKLEEGMTSSMPPPTPTTPPRCRCSPARWSRPQVSCPSAWPSPRWGSTPSPSSR
jgi:multidrug efflux pump